jgi:hypothetical protein
LDYLYKRKTLGSPSCDIAANILASRSAMASKASSSTSFTHCRADVPILSLRVLVSSPTVFAGSFDYFDLRLPFILGYENVTLANQVCTTVGSAPGSATVDGNTFAGISYGYFYSNLWRVRRSCFLCRSNFR